MKKIALLAAAGLLAVSAWFLWLRPHRPFSGNVLLITMDTTRADRIGAYGCRDARTPVLDRLAASGVLFEDCQTAVPLTLPSHSTLFTGRWPIAHNVRNNGTYFLAGGEPTLARLLKDRGYATGAVVAAFVLLSKFGLNQGFDSYDDTLDTHELSHNYKSEIPAERVSAKFADWLDRQDGRRFFAWVHFYDPHTPYLAHEATSGVFPHTPAGLYDGEISHMDAHIGRLLDKLRSRGRLDDTLIVLAGDHGEAFAEHGESGHGVFCYEETLHVPLIFHQPAWLGGPRRVRGRVGLVDVMPTILDLLGMPVPARVQGRSLKSWLRGEEAVAERPLYFESLYGHEEMNWAPLSGLIDGGFKYISLPDPELYDLAADRGERMNLFRRRNLLARDMDRRLQNFIRAHAESGGSTRRELSTADRDELQALGYLASFSHGGGRDIDPKRGVPVENRLQQIKQKIDRGQLDEAERELDALIVGNPEAKIPHAALLRYTIQSRRRDVKKMLATLRQAIQDFPEAEQFRVSLAVDLFDLRVYDRSEEQCRELLALHPRNTRAQTLLGDIREKQGRVSEAADFYRRARELEPNNVSLGIRLAELLIGAQRFGEALPVYDAIVETPEVWRQPDFVIKIALFQAQHGAGERAEAILEKLSRLRPGGQAFYNYGLVLARNGRGEAAVEALKKALRQFGTELQADQRASAEKALRLSREAGGSGM
jgi:arylsulfatase A-like enzyme/tetratricopeptide (TPR) repeat protein